MDFITAKISIVAPFSEMLQAELAMEGFDMFLENEEENGFECSIEENLFNEQSFQALVGRYRENTSVEAVLNTVKKENWNEVWENSFEPVIVENCIVRADFHTPDRPYEYEIIITPKMSFGTGHHDTTQMMLKQQLGLSHKGKKVVDLGCGTAILAIFAHKLGATHIEAYDIDDWVIDNAKENATMNHAPMHIAIGTADHIERKHQFDIILANINLNVLLEEMPSYAELATLEEAYIVFSGFRPQDLPILITRAEEFGFVEHQRLTTAQWASLCVKRK